MSSLWLRYAPAVLATAMLLAAPAGAASGGAERILSFHSAVTVRADASLEVTETIRVYAAGEQIKRGIYRDFPTRYALPGGGTRTVPFEFLEALRDGRPEPWFQKKRDNDVRTYLGREDLFLEPGEHTYTLRYRTARQIGFFKDHDELYWNVTGNDWAFPIEEAEAVVTLPPRVGGGVQLEAYTGRRGEKGRAYSASRDPTAGVATFRATRALAPGEGLTVVVMWPKGFVAEPGPGERRALWLSDHRSPAVALAGLLLVVGYYLVAWVRVGRDPARGAVVPQFEAPEGLSPAAVRYLRRMGYDHRAFAASVVNMAVRGYLTIRDEDGHFILARAAAGPQVLAPEERKAAEGLFSGRSEVRLEQANHAAIRKALGALQLHLKGTLEKVYFLTNRRYLIPGAVLSLLTLGAVLAFEGGGRIAASAFLTVWLTGWTMGVTVLAVQVGRAWRMVLFGRRTAIGKVLSTGSAVFLTLFALPFFAGELFGLGALISLGSRAYAALLLALGLLAVLFHYLLRAPTSAGRRLLDRIEGFEAYLAAAEADRISRLGPERTPALYEKFLPYAIALDLEEKWSERFADVLARAAAAGQAYQPAWYHGDFGRGGWDAAGFAGTVGASLSGAVAASSTAPGSSSGGGGGGSSGGGGGGGGGGGW